MLKLLTFNYHQTIEMFQVAYNPNLLNSLIKTVYVSSAELDDPKSEFYDLLDWDPEKMSRRPLPVVFGRDKDYLFCLRYVQEEWTFYHQNAQWHNLGLNRIDKLLEKIIDILDKQASGYIGVVQNGTVQIIVCIDNNGETEMNLKFGTLIIFRNKKLYKYNGSKYEETNFENYNDILVPAAGGLVHFNPLSTYDLIYSSMKFGKTASSVKDLAQAILSEDYYPHLGPTIQLFKKNMEKVKNIKPKSFYSQIYQLFRKHDKEYFITKMETFQQSVVQMFSDLERSDFWRSSSALSNFISEFVNDLKTDLTIEMVTVYHRLRIFPQERVEFYKKYGDHPYAKLIKMLHQYYQSTNGFITLDKVCSFLWDGDDLCIYTEKISLLREALARRSELFVFMYEQYLETTSSKTEPKFRTKCGYFPFKVFSASLFIMEHLDQ